MSEIHQIFTAGYAGRRVADLGAVASGYIIADIRREPYSLRLPEWNGTDLAAHFGERYKHVRELGNLNDGTDLKISLVDAPMGVVRILRYARRSPVVLLCGCLKYHECHRRVVAELLHPNCRQAGIDLPRELAWPWRHECHARGCNAPIEPSKLMCGRHWKMVPYDLRRAVIRHYRPGQELDGKTTMQYRIAANAAIEAVALAERDPVSPTPADGGQISLFAGHLTTAGAVPPAIATECETPVIVTPPRDVRRDGDEGRCKGCGASIRWVENERGNVVPMNLNWTSHFATCPQAGKFRKRKQ